MKLGLVILFLCSCVVGRGQPDLILYNGKIFTSNKRALWAAAMAIKGQRISAIGSSDVVLKLKGPGTRLIDLQGHVVVPGFNDAHTHIDPTYPAREIDLWHDPLQPTSWEAVRDSVLRVVEQVPPGTWITSTINPDLFDDKRAQRFSLDSIAPHHPVILSAWTGHGKLLNSHALTLTGLTEESVSPGGWLRKTDRGDLTGHVEEYAGFKIYSIRSANLTTDKIIEDIKNFHRYTASLGITTMQNICTAFNAEQVQKVYAFPHFSCRTRLVAFPTPGQRRLNLEQWTPVFRTFNNMNYGSGIKLILDGTPIERLACMSEPYKDRETQGKLNFSLDGVKEFMRFALENDQQIIIHAVGDSTVSTIIRAMRDLHPDKFWATKRLRLEHAEMAVVKKEDLQTLKSLGIVIVQNPLHLALPDIMKQRLSGPRTKYIQAMRTLLNNNIPFALGTDGPPNPFLNLMLATLHPDNPPEAITLEEAVIAYTLGSAYAEFSEKEKGTLEVGKLADLAVLSQDIFEIPKNALPTTQSILTILDGKIVHDAHILK
jgi:hypothetical protein